MAIAQRTSPKSIGSVPQYVITWEKLPEGFQLPDDPVENIDRSGQKANRNGYWIRWWDQQGSLLLWGLARLEE